MICFTNGCFDVIHAGHVQLLRRAKALGSRLIVGINTDESVRRLKGNGRPVSSLAERVLVLESIRWVDEVIPFPEDTPERLIESLKPAVLVKGDEGADPVGADLVRSWGGSVVLLSKIPGLSTTRIVESQKLLQGDGR